MLDNLIELRRDLQPRYERLNLDLLGRAVQFVADSSPGAKASGANTLIAIAVERLACPELAEAETP